jgi:copper transport protein
VLADPPNSIQLRFTEAVTLDLGGLGLIDPSGQTITLSAPALSVQNTVVTVPVALSERGTYTVTWRVTSEDGHTAAGSFVFHLGEKTRTTAAEVSHDRLVSLIGWFARCLGLGGALVFVGGAILAGIDSPLAREVGFQRLLRVSAIALAVGSAFIAIARAADAKGGSIWSGFMNVGRDSVRARSDRACRCVGASGPGDRRRTTSRRDSLAHLAVGRTRMELEPATRVGCR